MIDFYIHGDLLVFLRAVLFLSPLFVTFYLGYKHKENQRLLVGGLFSFLYSMGILLPAHALAIDLGMWQYGGDTLMLLGMPADLWFAGSLLFGPAIFFAFPHLNPFVFTVGFVVVQAFVFKSLDPFLIAGDHWFLGVSLIFLIVHIPALYLARWTVFDTHLIERACLLAFSYGFLAFFVLPTLIMQAMGGQWDLQNKSLASYMITFILLTPCVVMGLTAVHMFVVHGEGTPIPLDKTKYLVRSGIYAYITNPMQLCSALSWIIIGFFLQNAFVSMSAVMAVIFVVGLVHWHHRNDLQVRFPDGWPEYKKSVPAWFPKWKPCIKSQSKLVWNSNSNVQKRYVDWLYKQNTIGLEFIGSNENAYQYIDGNRDLVFKGYSGLIYPLFHINFFTALIASGLLLFVIPSQLIKGELNATS